MAEGLRLAAVDADVQMARALGVAEGGGRVDDLHHLGVRGVQPVLVLRPDERPRRVEACSYTKQL